MVSEVFKFPDLNNLTRLDCEEYISLLRYALLTAQSKFVQNELRYYIHKLEARINQLSHGTSYNQLAYFNQFYYDMG